MGSILFLRFCLDKFVKFMQNIFKYQYFFVEYRYNLVPVFYLQLVQSTSLKSFLVLQI